MKALVIAVLLLSSTADAQVVNVECPKSYPPKDTALEVAPAGHKGKGLIEKSELVGYQIFGGEFEGKAEFVSGYPKKVKGGTDIVDFSTPDWFVCNYRTGTSWWEQVTPKGKISEACVIQIRDNAKTIRLVCQ
jgi:hypothetical protein